MRNFFILMSILLFGTAFGQSYIQYADSADNYIRINDWKRAENAILSALRAEPANPSNPMLVINLGIVRNHLGQFEKAMESFDLALTRIPNSTIALTGRAEAYTGLNRLNDALSDLDRVLSVDSTLTLPLTMKGFILIRMQRPGEALLVFDRLTRQDADIALGFAGKGDCLAVLDRSQEAIEAYKHALKLEERPEWRLRTGLLMLENGDLEGASEQARLSIEANPRDGNIYVLMSLIHRKRFETAEAEIAEKMAVNLGADPEFIEIYLKK